MVHCQYIRRCKVGLSQNHIAGMEIKIPFVSVCRVSSFSFALTFTFWVLVWSIQTQKSVEFILICRCKVFRVFVLHHGMTALYFEKPIICIFILYLPLSKKEMYVMWHWAPTCLSVFSPGYTSGYTIGNTVTALIACRKTCSGVSKLQETSCLLHWCRKICHKRTHPLCCAFFSLEGGMDLNLQFRLPFNCFYCMKSGLLIHHYLISKVVSQQ